ncbi:polysaccharide biosynthesis C-terminal domain-containing protein [Hyphomonas sp. WL0036]|uniref:MATE family efflux transporter n=1 Tax=Hyphomonas sediminis TaxID=2866160 RepID=UPI001C806D46|nr:MATE family efflux transporter [Hyphomonas sediminis]MBY9065323.1 polysaccharide biosynthesis C-terminal domain-containing protein [Hyphomonas sediminis]
MTATSRLPAWARAKDILDLIRLSVPIAVSRMAMMLMGLTDAIVLGQYAPGELAFVLSAWLPIGVSLGFGIGILLGVQVLTSEMLGTGREAGSGRIFRRGLWWSLVLGALLTLALVPFAQPFFHWIFVTIAPEGQGAGQAVPPDVVASSTAAVTRILAFGLVGHMVSQACSYYLEALRRPLLVTIVMYTGVVINIFGNLALVAGWWGFPQMGAEGVAWSTTVTRWLIAIIMLIFVAALTPGFRRSPPAEAGEARRQFDVGTGTAISNVAEWGGFNVTFIIATWVSIAANAVYGYSVQVMGVCFMFYLGIATATSVRVAEAMGRGNPDEVRNAGRLGVAATFVMGIVMGVLLVSFAGPISRLLVREDAIIGGVAIAPAIAGLLWLAAAATVFDGLQATASFALRAQGMVWLPSAIHLSSFFVVMIPVCYLLAIVLERGAPGVLEGAFIGVFVAGTLQLILLELKAARSGVKRAA